MNELKMKDLEECFRNAKEDDANWIVIAVKSAFTPATEFIINPKQNFDNKLEYYKKAYTEDLTLKTNGWIQIVGFAYADTLQEIEFGWILK